MDGTAFDPSVPYEIREAYHNTFVTGILHPDRVMEDHDLIYLLEGEWEIRQEPPGGGEPACYTLHEGDVLILEAGRHHDGLHPCRDGTRTVYLHVHGPGRAADSADVPTPSFLPLGTFLSCRRSPEVLRLFEAIAEQFAAASPLRETRLAALFQLLLAALWDAEHTPAPSPDEEFVQNVVRFLQENPHRFFHQKELAARFFVCEKTLSRRFSAVMGETPCQFQRKYRLEAVRAFLLSHPNVSLRQAAANFGFCDEFHLSKAYKQHYGVSPGNRHAP